MSLQKPHLTPSACEKLKMLHNDKDNQGLYMRVFIEGGGCSGFQYNFMFDEEISDDDTIVGDEDEKGGSSGEGGLKLLVDPNTLQYLAGAEIDYKEDVDGERFVIRNNPNAKTTCGCGSSFSV